MSAFSLYVPSEGDDGDDRQPSPAMTLGQFYDAYYEPVYLLARSAAPANLAEIRQSLKYWQRFTGDPPLAEIGAWHCRDFVVGLKALPGRDGQTLSNNTIRKHCGAVQAMLDHCGPPDMKHRDRLGILDRPPYIQRPKRHIKPAEDCFVLAEIELLLANATAATLPGHLPCPAATYMRRLYLWTFNTGLRIGSTMRMRWGHYRGDHMDLPPDVMKGGEGKRLELNSWARDVVEAMVGCHAERIFPWPASWPSSKGQLYDQHALIRECLPPQRRFAFHGIRKLHNNDLARINPKACEKALGHKQGRTNVESYTSQGLVAEAVAQIQQPQWRPDAQQRLFD